MGDGSANRNMYLVSGFVLVWLKIMLSYIESTIYENFIVHRSQILQGHLGQFSMQNRCKSSSASLETALTPCCGNASASCALNAPFDLSFF